MYFSRFTRDNHLMLLAVWERLSEWIKEGKNQLSKDEKKWIKTACTYLIKASDSLIQRQDADYANRLLTAARNSEFVIREKLTVDISEKCEVLQEDLYELADHALVICQTGYYCKYESHRDCPLYKAMLNMGIPVADLEAAGCPYKLKVEDSSTRLEQMREVAEEEDI